MGEKIPTNMKSVLIFQSAGELDKEGATTQMEKTITLGSPLPSFLRFILHACVSGYC